MKTAWAIRHLRFEDLGLLDPLLRERGYDIHYHDAAADLPTPMGCDSADLLVVLGGPMTADDYAGHANLRDEVAILRQRRARDLPTLGICLGAQMMALAVGGSVRPMARKEIGWGGLQVADVAGSPLAGVSAQDRVLHWHGDEIALPDGFTSLASTRGCAVQAFAWSPRGLALQFHFEADPARIGEWTQGHAAELAAVGIDPAALQRDAAALGARQQALAARVMGRWLDRLED
jgi:GMP synthase (glutamine-hydrolysing)